MSITIGTKLAMNNRDFLEGIASSKIGLKALEAEVRKLDRELAAHNRIMGSTRGEFDKLAKNIRSTTSAGRALSLNFYELRSAMRNLVTRSAITGFSAVAGAITSLASVATAAVTSLTNLTGALSLAGGAGLTAAFQGIGVAALGLNKVLKALTTTGKDHVLAMGKLTPAARQFEKALSPLRSLYREIQLLSQAGLFPGLESALKRVQGAFGPLKQIVYDTAVNMGYLADRAAAMFQSRGGIIKSILENNIKLIQVYGRAAENFGFGILSAWQAAIPVIDHVAGSIEKFSKKFMRSMEDWNKNGSLGDFFQNFKTSFDNWTSILGKFGTTLFNVFKASQPAAHYLEDDLKSIFTLFADWTGKNGNKMQSFFIRQLKPFEAFAGFLGKSIALIVHLGDVGADTTTRFFDGLSTKLLPIIEQLALVLQKDFVGSVGNLASAILGFISVAIPAVESILKPLELMSDGFAAVLRTMTNLVDWSNSHFGKLGGIISTALAVGGITATWVALRVQIASVMGLMGVGTAYVKKQAARPQQAIVGTLRNGATRVTEPILGGRRAQAAYDARRATSTDASEILFTSDRINRGGVITNPYVVPASAGTPIWRQQGRGAVTPGIPSQPRVISNMGEPIPYGASSSLFFEDQGLTPRGGRRILASSAPRDMFVQTIPPIGEPRSRGSLRPGVSMLRGSPSYATSRYTADELRPPKLTKMSVPLQGGQGATMFKDYQAQMEKSTKTGFLGGLKNMFKGSGGGAALGTIASLAGSIGLAVAIPVGISLIGALAGKPKDRDPHKLVGGTNAPIFGNLAQQANRLGVTKTVTAGRGLATRTFPEVNTANLNKQLGDVLRNKDISQTLEGLRKLRTSYSSLGDTLDAVGKKNNLKDFADQIGAAASRASSSLLSTLVPDFQTFGSASKDSVGHVLDALSVLQVQITAKLPVGGQEFKTAMAASFGSAADAMKTAMANGLVSTKSGLAEITKLVYKEFTELGFTPEQARNLAKTGDLAGKTGGNEHTPPTTGKTTSPGKTTTTSTKTAARGAYVAGKGRVGRDSVPMSVNGRQIVTAPGEYVGVFTRHQQRKMEGALGMSMPAFFNHNNAPHFASGGLITPTVSPNTGLIGGLGQGAINRAASAANQLIVLAGGSVSDSGATTSGKAAPAGRVRDWLTKALKITHHFSASNLNLLYGRTIQESGGNPGIVNTWDINAQRGDPSIGLIQTTGSTFRSYHLPGYDDIRNGVDNAIAAIRYMYARYGHIVGPGPGGYAEGGIIGYAAGGVPSPPPVTGNKAPSVSPGNAVTPGSKTKPKKTKAKAKKVVRIAGNKPTVGAGIGPNQFKPASKQPKPHARKNVKNIISKKFGVKDSSFIDPITGESLDVSTYGPLKTAANIETGIGRLQQLLSASTSTAGLTDETAIVSLYDSAQYADLTDYLKNVMGKDDAGVADWIAKNGDSMDVINQSGMTIQGQPVRGIAQAVAELQAQLAFHTTTQPVHDTFGILGGLNAEQNIAQHLIPSVRAIKERVARMASIKKTFEANVALRKSYAKKLNGMKAGSYSWKQAVAHNSDIITNWRRWKRDSVGEPLSDTDEANHEIDRLTDLNKQLNKSKPKGRAASSDEYQKTLLTYQGRGVENRMLVGDKDATVWDPTSAGGFTGKISTALTNWRAIDNERMQMVTSLPGSISDEQGNIASILADIKQWTGSTITPQPIDRGAASQMAQQQTDLANQMKMDQLIKALVGGTQFGTLTGFSQMLGMRMLGAYAHGGLVPETGVALVHKGEYINPAPDGPFRNGMNAQGGGSNHFVIEQHYHGNSGELVKLIDTRVKQVAPGHTSSTLGRKARRIAVAPGR